MKKLTLLFLIIFAIPLTSLAWDRQGHQAVSAVAYATLTPNQRQKMDGILRYHPWYNVWRGEYQQSPPPHVSFEAYAFIRAAAWPDDIRGNPQYHHGTWHYVNYPASLPNSINTNSPIGTGVLQIKVQECMNSVRNETQTTAAHRTNRAIMLSWLLHLVGDLHQPLHSVALVNSTYPHGDHGGNDFLVRKITQSSQVKLHSFWDDILGTSQTVPAALALATQLMQQMPLNSSMVTGNYHDWINDSGRIALENVYQFRPPGGALHPIGDHGSVLPGGYENQAKLIAAKQVVLGGYRLASTLAQLVP